MKKFMTKVQNIGNKAAQIQAAIQSVPPKLAQMTESVAVTAGQLQQLRSSLQSSVTDLRVDNPDRILEALQEIHDSTGVFAEAGYDLAGVDMELSPVQRLIVHLDKVEDVAHPLIRALISQNQNLKTVHALLSSLLQAEAVVDRVALSELSYRTLIVNVGPIPSIRLCWRAEEAEEAQPTAFASQPATTNSPTAAPTSAFAQSSFFESRTRPTELTSQISAGAISPAVQTASSPPEVQPGSVPAESQPAGGTDWKLEAFERLKKSPHVSKYGSRR